MRSSRLAFDGHARRCLAVACRTCCLGSDAAASRPALRLAAAAEAAHPASLSRSSHGSPLHPQSMAARATILKGLKAARAQELNAFKPKPDL